MRDDYILWMIVSSVLFAAFIGFISSFSGLFM